MARMTVDGHEFLTERLGKMTRGMIRDITLAGAKAAEERMKANTEAKKHIRNKDMLDAISHNEYREFFQGGATDVYPLGDDRKGVRNATKAYVINYGKGKRPYTKRPKRNPQRNKTGDHFITGDETGAEEAVRAAMQAESDRLISEIG